MLAYISPSTTNSAQPSPTLPPRDPTISTLSPTSTVSSPRFLAANQAPHPSPPPSSTIASAFPRSKTMAKVPRLNLSHGNVGFPTSTSGTRRRSKDRGSGSKRFESVVDALRELEAILMGDEEESESEEEERQSDSDDAFISSGAVSMELKPIKPTIKQLEVHSSSTTTISPVSNQRPLWSTGAAREFSRFQLVVDIPVWSSDCGADYSTLLQLRDTTLQALHVIIDNLRLRGVSTTHRICLTTIEDRNESGQAAPVYGCIRVAPPFNTPLSKLGPSFNMGGRSLLSDRMMGPLHMRRSTMGPGVATTQASGVSPGVRAHEAARLISDELERDRVKRGCPYVEEGQSFIVGLYGQPALVLT